MASGLRRCMYCEDSEGSGIEHFAPKESHPEKTYAWTNLLWVCAACNNAKNTAWDPALLDPTHDDPLDHIHLRFGTGELQPAPGSPRGAVTLRVLRSVLGTQTRAKGRRNAATRLREFLRLYEEHLAAGRHAEAQELRAILVTEPFSMVFAAVLRTSAQPGARDVLSGDLVDRLRRLGCSQWLDEADQARWDAAHEELLAEDAKVRVEGPETSTVP